MIHGTMKKWPETTVAATPAVTTTPTSGSPFITNMPDVKTGTKYRNVSHAVASQIIDQHLAEAISRSFHIGSTVRIHSIDSTGTVQSFNRTPFQCYPLMDMEVQHPEIIRVKYLTQNLTWAYMTVTLDDVELIEVSRNDCD